MAATREHLVQRIRELEAAKAQSVANANACAGAIAELQALLVQFYPKQAASDAKSAPTE
jgi:hypothetical protein